MNSPALDLILLIKSYKKNNFTVEYSTACITVNVMSYLCVSFNHCWSLEERNPLALPLEVRARKNERSRPLIKHRNRVISTKDTLIAKSVAHLIIVTA